MKRSHQITLNDIARRLKVSKVTVSKALRDHPDISLATKRKVKKTAEELGYTPNFLARNLSSKRSNTIGLVVPKIAHHFFASVIESIYDTAFQNNYEIVLMVSQENAKREVQHIKTLLSMRVDGFLISVTEQTTDISIFKTIKKMAIPLIFFDRIINNCSTSSVTTDDEGGAQLAVDHAIRTGYRDIGHLAGFSYTNIGRDRHTGFKKAMAKHHLPINPSWVIEGGFSEQDGYDGFMQLYSNGKLPQIIFAVTFPVALGAFTAMKENGLLIPDDIDLICFGDSDYNKFISPTLTCVDQPADELGKKAVEALIEEIEQPENRKPQRIVIPTKLNIHETCLYNNHDQ